MSVELGLQFIKPIVRSFYVKTLSYAASRISLTHFLSHTLFSLTLKSAMLWAGGWSKQLPKPDFFQPKSSSDPTTCGLGNPELHIHSLPASHASSLPRDILTPSLKLHKSTYPFTIIKVHPKKFLQCTAPSFLQFLPIWPGSLHHTQTTNLLLPHLIYTWTSIPSESHGHTNQDLHHKNAKYLNLLSMTGGGKKKKKKESKKILLHSNHN